MELLEKQSELRAADSHAYVRWVREMESLGTPEAKDALSAARRSASGLSIEPAPEVNNSPVTEDSWKALVPDWDERQDAVQAAKEKAVADALAQAEERAREEIETAVAAAIAEAEFEAELKREEAVAKVVAEAEAAAAEKLAEQLRIAEEQAAEEARVEAERLEALEAERVEAERVEAERVEDERVEAQRLEALEADRVIREEIEAAEVAVLEAQIAAEESAAISNAELVVDVDSEPEPVRAADFATGSFDIIDSAEQAASEDFDEDSFEVLLQDGELGFAKEPASSAQEKPISTIDRQAKPYSQLFVWSSLSVGLLPILLGYLTLSLELTFLDKVMSMFGGLAVSALLIAVAAVGGKRSGLPTLYLSRAAFGVKANYLPAIALVIVKIAFGLSVLLVAIGLFDRSILGAPSFASAVAPDSGVNITWLMVVFAVLMIIGAVLAFFGGKVLYISQMVVAGIGTLVFLAFGVITVSTISLDSTDLSLSGNWVGVVALGVLVAAIFGGFWISAVAEFTRKVSMAQSGKKLGLFIALSAGIIPLLMATYALAVSASLESKFTEAAIDNPLGALLALVPTWMGSMLLVSGALSILIWSASWLYSTSVSLTAVSIRVRPAISQPLLVLLLVGLSYLLLTLSSAPLIEIFDAVLAISGVLVFAWAGIFVADISLRKIAYHEVSLTRDYGFYKSVNVVNLIAYIFAVALGFGFVSSSIVGLGWLGYLAELTSAQDWASANVGIVIALGFSVLFPILFGRKRIRGQEDEVLAIEARKRDLEHVELSEI
jgi:purine-cytosine permease-like protein